MVELEVEEERVVLVLFDRESDKGLGEVELGRGAFDGMFEERVSSGTAIVFSRADVSVFLATDPVVFMLVLLLSASEEMSGLEAGLRGGGDEGGVETGSSGCGDDLKDADDNNADDVAGADEENNAKCPSCRCFSVSLHSAWLDATTTSLAVVAADTLGSSLLLNLARFRLICAGAPASFPSSLSLCCKVRLLSRE